MDEDYQPAAAVIAAAYRGHIDSDINDQYRSLNGSLRFLNNIVRFPGCGVFDAVGVVRRARADFASAGWRFALLAGEGRCRAHHASLPGAGAARTAESASR